MFRTLLSRSTKVCRFTTSVRSMKAQKIDIDLSGYILGKNPPNPIKKYALPSLLVGATIGAGAAYAYTATHKHSKNVFINEGRTTEVVNTINGLSDGESLAMFPNGNVAVRYNFKKGVQHDACITYFKNKPNVVRTSVIYDMGKVSKVLTILDDLGRDNILGQGVQTTYKVCKKNPNGYLSQNNILETDDETYVIAELEIGETVERVTPLGLAEFMAIPKSRVKSGVVKRFLDEKGNELKDVIAATSYLFDKDKKLVYRVAETVTASGLDKDLDSEHGEGIGVYMYVDQAIETIKYMKTPVFTIKK